MGVEIERKFLVVGDAWRRAVTESHVLRQGYLSRNDGFTVRVRTDGKRAWLTLKDQGLGIARGEFEYGIPTADADELLGACGGRVIAKVRHIVSHGRHRWEVDVFEGDNVGLVLAEVELASEHEGFERPPWLGDEVTGDRRYYNSSLAEDPMGQTKMQEK